jgi:hypothetical protein
LFALPTRGAKRISLADREREKRVVSEGVVVVQVAISQDQSEHSLGNEVGDSVLDPILGSVVFETIGKTSEDPRLSFNLSEQERP